MQLRDWLSNLVTSISIMSHIFACIKVVSPMNMRTLRKDDMRSRLRRTVRRSESFGPQLYG